MEIKLKNNKNKTKEEILVENLKEVKEIFDKHNIKFWLDWGTLLGAIREGKIITWDKDIDLGVIGSDYEKIISAVPELKKRGFLISEVPIPGSEFISVKFAFTRFKYHLDINLYYNIKDKNTMDEDNVGLFVEQSFSGNFFERIPYHFFWLLWRSLLAVEMNPESKYKLVIERITKYCLSFLPNKLKNYLIEKVKRRLFKGEKGISIRRIIVPKHYFENLESIEFYGATFDIPSNVEEYLKYKYGEDWETPKKEWSWMRDDGAVQSLAKNNNH